MKTTAQQDHFKSQFRTRSGFKIKVSFQRVKSGEWKIFSVGGVGIPTALLPFDISRLVYSAPFESLEDAKLAVKSA